MVLVWFAIVDVWYTMVGFPDLGSLCLVFSIFVIWSLFTLMWDFACLMLFV